MKKMTKKKQPKKNEKNKTENEKKTVFKILSHIFTYNPIKHAYFHSPQLAIILLLCFNYRFASAILLFLLSSSFCSSF